MGPGNGLHALQNPQFGIETIKIHPLEPILWSIWKTACQKGVFSRTARPVKMCQNDNLPVQNDRLTGG